MVVICNIYKSVSDLLPHFFNHYFFYGVTHFMFGIHGGSSNPAWEEIPSLSPSPSISIKLFKSYDGDIDGRKEGESLNMLRMNAESPWVIPVDLDEFHVSLYPTFRKLIEECERDGADYVSSVLIDRITNDGSIPQSISKEPIAHQFPRRSFLTREVVKACCDKVCLSRQSFRLNDG